MEQLLEMTQTELTQANNNCKLFELRIEQAKEYKANTADLLHLKGNLQYWQGVYDGLRIAERAILDLMG